MWPTEVLSATKPQTDLLDHDKSKLLQQQQGIGNNRRVDSLDGLRAIAVVLVILGHSFENLRYFESLPHYASAILGNSSFGVRLFFVLSGFLITKLLCNEKSRNGRISFRAFYVRRSLRIFPALFVYILAIFLLSNFGYLSISTSQFVAASTFTWNYGGTWIRDGSPEGSWFLGHLWTLSLEEQFYLLWPLLFVVFSSGRLFTLTLLLIALMPVVRLGTYLLVPEWRGLLGMMFHTSIDSILVGCVFALVGRRLHPFVGRRLHPFIESVMNGKIKSKLWIVATAIPLLISPLLRLQFGGAYSITIGVTADAICAGLMITQLYGKVAPRFATRILELPLLTWIGRLSYSLYLWQQLFLTEWNHTWFGKVPVCYLAILATASISFYAIEIPCMRLRPFFYRLTKSQSPR